MVGSRVIDEKALARDRRCHARQLDRAQVFVARAGEQLHNAVAALSGALQCSPSAAIEPTVAVRQRVEAVEQELERVRVVLWERIEEVG